MFPAFIHLIEGFQRFQGRLAFQGDTGHQTIHRGDGAGKRVEISGRFSFRSASKSTSANCPAGETGLSILFF
jgi:hypothetical protein